VSAETERGRECGASETGEGVQRLARVIESGSTYHDGNVGCGMWDAECGEKYELGDAEAGGRERRADHRRGQREESIEESMEEGEGEGKSDEPAGGLESGGGGTVEVEGRVCWQMEESMEEGEGEGKSDEPAGGLESGGGGKVEVEGRVCWQME